MLSLFLAVGYGSATMAQTLIPAPAQPCVQPPEQVAFNIISLKSALMVGALSCNETQQYNAFMKAFQPYILSEQTVMDSYFGRSGGLASQMQEDDYVTALANNQSQASIALGPKYCALSALTFSTVLALKSDAALAQFTTTHKPLQPMTLVICTQLPVTRPAPPVTTVNIKVPTAVRPVHLVSLPPPSPAISSAPHVVHLKPVPRNHSVQVAHATHVPAVPAKKPLQHPVTPTAATRII